nr:MAG TPA: restriction endonuclease [Caudoviricetes sp.]
MTYKFYEGRVNSNLSIDRIDSTKGYTKDNI